MKNNFNIWKLQSRVVQTPGSVEYAECGVRSAECGVRSAECRKCGVWKMRSVENAECGKCGVWKMRSVENAECGKCGVKKKINFPFQFPISVWKTRRV